MLEARFYRILAIDSSKENSDQRECPISPVRSAVHLGMSARGRLAPAYARWPIPDDLISPSSGNKSCQSYVDFIIIEAAVAVEVIADRDRYRFQRVIFVVHYVAEV
jgi:hypothetical protein